MLMSSRVSRRNLVVLSAGAFAGALLAACGSPPAATPAPPAAAAPPTQAPAAGQAAAPAPPQAAAAQAPGAAKPATSGQVVNLRYITRGQPSASTYKPLWDEF